MCEYCGCQALVPIDELTREHELVLSLISQVRPARAGGDLPRMADLAQRIAAVLGPHTLVEEQALFPALASEFPDQIAVLEAEHRRIDAVLAEAAAGPPEDPAWPGRLAETLAVLREHIFKEQDGVFPAALASLRTDDWEAVEAARARAGSLLRTLGSAGRPQPGPAPEIGTGTEAHSNHLQRTRRQPASSSPPRITEPSIVLATPETA